MYKVSELKPKQTNNNNKKSWEKKDEKKEGSEEGRKHTCSKGKSGEIT